MLETIYNNFDLGYYSCLDGYVYTKQNDLVAIAEEIAADTQGREINSVYIDHAKRAIIIGRIDD